jgi:type IV secretion system protein VirB8
MAANRLHALALALRRCVAADQWRERRGPECCQAPTGSAAAMNAQVTQPDPGGYFAEAARWDTDRVEAIARGARIAWRVAAAGWICAISSGCALLLLMPLKRVDPFVIRVDNSTGVVDVVPVYAGGTVMDEAVSRYFLTHYVMVCERFNYFAAESDYEECGAFHTAQRNQAWYALWQRSNPNSPLNLHRDGSQVRAQVQSISFFKRTGGTSDLAQVRYLKSELQASGAQPRVSRWIATIQYAYAAPSKDPKLRSLNPLGFKIVEFNSEPEVTGDVRQAVAAPGKELAP